jgi:hypothetical protein
LLNRRAASAGFFDRILYLTYKFASILGVN